MVRDELDWLTSWFQEQCHDPWLQGRGIKLMSTENPGWWLQVDLRGTTLEPRALETILSFDGEPSRDESGEIVLVGKPGHSYTATGARWFVCGIEEGIFHAAGDPTRLRDLFRSFREWSGVAAGERG